MAHLVEGAVVSQLVVSRARSGSEERVQHLHEDLGGDEFCLPAAPELQLVPVSLVAVQHLVELASDLRNSLGDVVAFGLVAHQLHFDWRAHLLTRTREIVLSHAVGQLAKPDGALRVKV